MSWHFVKFNIPPTFECFIYCMQRFCIINQPKVLAFTIAFFSIYSKIISNLQSYYKFTTINTMLPITISIIIPLQEIIAFFTRNFGQKNPCMDFLPPCPTWPKWHFGQIDLDPTVLTRSFWLVFFIRFFLPSFLLNHRDNNIIWVVTQNIYYVNYFIYN
jgi:hypothetical protein